MIAYLIDPNTKAIFTCTPHDISALIGAIELEIVRLSEPDPMTGIFSALYIAEVAQYPSLSGYFQLGDSPKFYGGRGLLVGLNTFWNPCPMPVTLARVRELVKFPALAPTADQIRPILSKDIVL